MSEENVEVVARLYDAIARRDLDGVLALYAPDVELDASHHPLTRLIGGRRTYRGHEGLRMFFRERREALADAEDTCDELIDAGDQIVVVGTIRGRGRASGLEVELKGGAGVWTVRNGKVTRVAFFPTRSEALEAAGLQE